MKKVIISLTVLFAAYQANAQEAVDLGLSVKWATMNVGATRTSEGGDNYHWGDTKKYSPNEAYFDSNNSIISHEGKFYNKVVISGTKYDVARQRWGGKWRMPTYIELSELFDDCKKERITINNKNYIKFIGTTGKSILLPLFSREDYYWSATMSDGSDSHARCLRLSQSLTGGSVFGDMRRNDIAWVRPVMDYDDNEYSDYRERVKANAKTIAASGNSYKMNSLYEFARSLYYGDNGYMRNKKLAYYIINELADKGHESSKKMLSKMSVKGGEVKKKNTLEDYAEQAVKGDKTAQEYILKHQNEVQQSQEVLKKIAMAYVPSKCDFSKGWDNYCCYTAALMGNDKACVELADNGMKDSDLDTAIGLYEFAAKANNLDAMHRLGKIYLDQTLGRRDLEKGIYWYTKAADGGHSQAKRELGTFYKYGLNVKKNQKLAKLYLGSDYDD